METQSFTMNIDVQTYQNLKLLAGISALTESELAAEAVRIFIEDQSWQIEAIKQGIRQADEGKFASEQRIKDVFSKWGIDA
ncbi:Uncharacterized protein dnl_04560 [Desulfonema limicola]|uniref:Uncharacterized protein n=1 Tax=Desulfonema limicola TaxID=45656 RepID=A0A975GEH0_9BACT|nr:hypothetical protein [Desulfonema limicola]QTA78236.1 Uncharacterized protein dnl_04560 [Desulfonema limicola]